MSVGFVAKWYTRASRVRIVIAKFDGRIKLPGGPFPIPELIAVLAGTLATLFMLPRTGHPFLTLGVGVVVTVFAVGVMRQMPYSPVPMLTRLHRVMRLYTGPVSVSTSSLTRTPTTTSTVRPQIDILDIPDAGLDAPAYPRRRGGKPAPEPQPLVVDLFAAPRSPAADLFG